MKKILNSHWFSIIIITITTLIIYKDIYDYPFVFDDGKRIVNEFRIRDFSFFSSFKNLIKPRMIVDLTYAINFKFGNLNVLGYHLVNVIIHILNGIIVLFLTKTIFQEPI